MREDQAKRFWPKVQKTRSCWLWIGSKLPRGYGRFWLGTQEGRCDYAHRFSYESHFGAVGRMQVCHKCDNPMCVRPSHLFVGTQADNMNDKVLKNRQLRGIEIHNAKLTENDVREIRRLRGAESQRSIASRYGVDQVLISCVQTRKIWKHVP